jgi:hypothetical protein
MILKHQLLGHYQFPLSGLLVSCRAIVANRAPPQLAGASSRQPEKAPVP